jgi:hypothetical protein
MTEEQFKSQGFFVINDAISIELRDFVTQYALFDEMQDFADDPRQVPGAHGKYADPALESLLLMLHPLFEKTTGLELYPTYSYYRIYREGNELPLHKDRNSCEISGTLCFNYSYNEPDYHYPIFMSGYKFEQNPGDLIIYKGTELDHWRPSFEQNGGWHVQGFFHYVDKNGSNADWKYDKRESIGEILGTKYAAKSYITKVRYGS